LQLPVDDLEVHQPVYLFTQVVPPLMLCASRKVFLFSVCFGIIGLPGPQSRGHEWDGPTRI
jgi:hypothetical protein